MKDISMKDIKIIGILLALLLIWSSITLITSLSKDDILKYKPFTDNLNIFFTKHSPSDVTHNEASVVLNSSTTIDYTITIQWTVPNNISGVEA